MPKVSVIIPAYNEEKVIDACLESLVRQTFRDFEVLIIDDCSTDSSLSRIKAYVAKYPNFIFLKEYGKVGPGRARNLAAKEARGEIFAFMDADCIATTTWIENLLKGFNHENVGSTGGPHVAPADSSPFQIGVENFFKSVSSLIGFYKSESRDIVVETSHNPLCNVAYRAEVFRKVGGFREDIWPGEDVAIDFDVQDQGYRITYYPKAVVFHHRPESIEQFRRVMFAYGRAQGKLIRVFGLRRRLQWVFVGSLFLFLVFIGLAFASGSAVLLGVITSLLAILFFLRPRSPAIWSLWFNSFEWIKGFMTGFVSNSALPPFGKSQLSNQRS